MIRVILAFIIFASQSSLAEEESASVELLPLAARQELARWNFKFKILQEEDFTSEVRDLFKDPTGDQPMKIEGDFNADKLNDYVVIGEAGKLQYVVALISNKTNFKAVVVRQWSRSSVKKTESQDSTGLGVSTYLAKVKPGEIPGRKQKYDMLQIETYGAATELFEIQNMKAKKLN